MTWLQLTVTDRVREIRGFVLLFNCCLSSDQYNTVATFFNEFAEYRNDQETRQKDQSTRGLLTYTTLYLPDGRSDVFEGAYGRTDPLKLTVQVYSCA